MDVEIDESRADNYTTCLQSEPKQRSMYQKDRKSRLPWESGGVSRGSDVTDNNAELEITRCPDGDGRWHVGGLYGVCTTQEGLESIKAEYDAADADDAGLQGSQRTESSSQGEGTSRPTAQCIGDVTEPVAEGFSESLPDDRGGISATGNAEGDPGSEVEGVQGGEIPIPGRSDQLIIPGREIWEENWVAVAACLCRVDDGLPAWLDEHGARGSKHREHRLTSLGNAIVPQQIYPILKYIADIENNA